MLKRGYFIGNCLGGALTENLDQRAELARAIRYRGQDSQNSENSQGLFDIFLQFLFSQHQIKYGTNKYNK